jgi:hypothetical protein
VREAKGDDRREKQRVERKQEREDKLARQEKERARKEAKRIDREQEARQKKREAVLAEIALLPRLTHVARLKEAAKRLGEDFDALHEEFEFYYAARTIPEALEPWPDPVDLAELLGQIETKFCRYVVVSKAIATATTSWTVFAWVVELAVHAPKLVSSRRSGASWRVRLFAALQPLVSAREWVLSADICKALNADPTGEWCNFAARDRSARPNSPPCFDRMVFVPAAGCTQPSART